jgi:hypothetical protein
VVENSSQDVSALARIEARVGIIKVELVDMISEITTDGVGDEPLGNRELKGGEVSSGVVTEEDDGDSGGTKIG